MGKATSVATRRATTTTSTISSSSSSKAAVAAAEVINMKRKKKKGRPSLLDLQKRQQQHNNKTLTPPPPSTSSPALPLPNSTPPRRSTRRNPLNYSNSPSSEFLLHHHGDFADDDDDEREQKKVKLVVRLPQSSSQPPPHHFRDSPSLNSAASGSDSDAEDHPAFSPKKRKINARSDDAVLDQGEKTSKVTGTVHGSPLESGPTTPLPDKTMLVFVLHRLQKKDTYGVFSEPVDPNELPDYHDIIEQPMDFGTVRKKLDGGVYLNLEQLEADVMLICSNAMQYNAPDTIYFRQAQSIQELAKRDFENLRNEGDNGEPQPKVVRRGRPPSKNLKKPVESSPADRVVHEPSSVATLASGEDKAHGSNGYNLRKGPAIYRFRSNDSYGTSHRTRNGENYSDWLVDWNGEFPASILRADMKYGKKHFSVDENRRDTFKQFQPSPSSSEQSLFSDAHGDMKRLLAVGLHLEPHAYARSLARYAANLGPVAWNVASRKLRSALPDGPAFGPGWVEENDTSTQPFFSAEKLKPLNGLVFDRDFSRPANASSTTDFGSAIVHRPSGGMAETSRRLNSQNELADQGGALCWTTPGTSSQLPQKSAFHPIRNGFNGMFGSEIGIGRLATPPGQPGLEDGSITGSEMHNMRSAGGGSSLHSNPSSEANSEERIASENWGASSQSGNVLGQQGPESQVASEVGTLASPPPQVLAAQHRQPPPGVPPDLNIRVQASGSPSSSLQIGSPQPDIALQL